MKPRLRVALWSLAALLAAALLALLLRPAPVEVEVANVARGSFVRTVDEEARTRVRERYIVSAPLAGRLLRVTLKAGDAVAADAPVVTLLPTYPALLDVRSEQELTERVGAAEARLLAAQGAVDRAQSAAALARSELARVASLAAQGFVSAQAKERAEREADLRTKDVTVAQQERHATEHDLAVARAALAYVRQTPRAAEGTRFVVRAPVAGRVLRVLQESEATVNVGTPVLELGDPASLEVVAEVLTADAESVAPGNAVKLDRGRGVPLTGRVRVVEPGAFTKVSALGVEEQRTRVVIDLVTPRDAWADLGDAYRLDAHIAVESLSDVVTIPTGALFRTGEQWSVYVVADGRARLTPVRLRSRSQQQAVVEDGVTPGTAVILYPGGSVRDGTRVRVRSAR